MDPLYRSARIPALPVQERILYFSLSSPTEFPSLEEEVVQEIALTEDIFQKLHPIKKVYSNDDIPFYANLARMDDVYDLFSCVPDTLTYLSLNNGPGWYDAYMHYKLSYNCAVLAMSLPQYELHKVPGFLFNPRSFQILSGKGATRDLREEHVSFLDHFYRAYVGMDFALCSLPWVEDDNANVQFLCVHIYLALQTLNKGSSAVFELPGLNSSFEEELVFVCARNFAQISIFKPISSSLSNSQRYLVCKGFQKDAQTLTDLRSAVEDIFSLNTESKIFTGIDANFSRWFRVVNAGIDMARVDYYKKVSRLSRNEEVILERYNQTLIWAGCQLIK